MLDGIILIHGYIRLLDAERVFKSSSHVLPSLYLFHDLCLCLQGEYGDVSSRRQLRKNLQCKSFNWFVNNIYPELFIPGDAVASGEVSHQYNSSLFFDTISLYSLT